jgi:hypothetical protein
MAWQEPARFEGLSVAECLGIGLRYAKDISLSPENA